MKHIFFPSQYCNLDALAPLLEIKDIRLQSKNLTALATQVRKLLSFLLNGISCRFFIDVHSLN